MRRFRTRLSVALLAALLFACGADDGLGEAELVDGAAENAETGSAYRVVLGNAITDTLRGEAAFGIAYEPASGRHRFVIRLHSDYDFAGGFVLAHRDTTLPAAGRYDFALSSDSLEGADEAEFLLLYREGMLRDLRASSGSLELTTVADTLIAGTFDARLRGRVAALARPGDPRAEVHAVGRFRARPDLGGLIIGL